MDKRVAEDLVKARRHVKQKYKSLKSEIARSEVELQRRYQPITQPLREFITGVKTELLTPKEEPLKTEVSSPIPTSTPKKFYKRLPPARRIGMPREPSPIAQRMRTTSVPSPDISVFETEVLEESGIPTLDQLKEQLAAVGFSPEFQTYIDETFSGRAKMYMENMFKDTKNEFDHHYGVRFHPESHQYLIGDAVLTFDENDFIIKKPSGTIFKYTGTPGFYELVFKKAPIGYTQSDLQKYKDLLTRTNATRRGYIEGAQLHGTGKKYSNIIRPLLTTPGARFRSESTPTTPVTRSKTRTLPKRGGGDMRVLNYNNKQVEFIPWKDPNKLVDRLRLLLSSKSAGHTGHTNEIIYIIDELRAAKIIE